MTIKHRIFGLSTFLCLLIAGLSLFSIKTLLTVREASLSVTDNSLPQMICAGKIDSDLAQNQLRIVRLLLAQTPEERQKIQQEMAEISASISKSITNYQATSVDSEDKAHLDKVLQAREDYLKEEKRFFAVLSTNHDEAQNLAATALRPAFETYEKAGQALLEYSSRDAEACSKELGKEVTYAIGVIGICAAVGLLIGIAASLLNIRVIIKPLTGLSSLLNDNAQQISAASKEIASASQSLAEGASEQAASLQETSASVEEMSSMSRQTAEHAREAKSVMQKEVAANLQRTEEEMKRMSAALEENISASEQTARIIKTIDEIAFQTNILALNAAVEAARAGEAGAGFAVVADEVRNLAQRSAQAAKDTQELINTSLDKTKETQRLFQTITELRIQNGHAAAKISQFVTEVSTASEQQSQGISQINTAVSQMDKVTQANAAGAEESASAAEQLYAQAGSLTDSVKQLLTLVGANQVSQAPDIQSQPEPEPRPQAQPPRRPAKIRTAVSVHEAADTQDPLPMPKLEKSVASVKKLRSGEIPMDADFKDF